MSFYTGGHKKRSKNFFSKIRGIWANHPPLQNDFSKSKGGMVNFSLSKFLKTEALPAASFHTEKVFKCQCSSPNLRCESKFFVINTRKKSNLQIIGWGGLGAKPPEEIYGILRTFCNKNAMKIALGDAIEKSKYKRVTVPRLNFKLT